ncbi:MAG: alkaline phosphatase [Segetibacter sp.]|nr:alkaline phosphatase [Segetibacter sp.]
MHLTLFCFFCFFNLSAFSQPYDYYNLNGHSHNDYKQKVPFWDAYNHGFESIEADIFLVKEFDELLVAHKKKELGSRKIRLDSTYLMPIVDCIRKNGGSPFPDKSKKLQLLIDVKTNAVATLNKLVETIERFPELTQNPLVQFTISGKRPWQGLFEKYPSYIMFDGELRKKYSKEALAKIALMSANLKDYTTWNGKGKIYEKDKKKIESEINLCHSLNKPLRFWDAPDNLNAWQTLINIRVDFINTNKISSLAKFLKDLPYNSSVKNNTSPGKSGSPNKKVVKLVLAIEKKVPDPYRI